MTDEPTRRIPTRRIRSNEDLLAIDLSGYRRIKLLRVGGEFSGIDWQREEDKGRFLQAAAKLGIPFETILANTKKLFGKLEPPPTTAALVEMEPFPPFDPMVQTPEEWGAAAIERVKELTDDLKKQIEDGLSSGIYIKFPRRRKSRKSGIDDDLAYTMAVKHHFHGVGWFDLADEYPPPGRYSKLGLTKKKQRENRASLIQIRVTDILEPLKLLPSKNRLK